MSENERPKDGEWMAHAGPPPEPPKPEERELEPDVPDELGADFAMDTELAAAGATADAEPLPAPTAHDAPPDIWEHLEPEVRAEDAIPDLPVIDGDVIRTLEWYFPVAWAAMLMIVCYIGIYYAVERLPGGNPLPPSFQF